MTPPLLWLYRALFTPALVALAPRYGLRMIRRGGYGPGFTQRRGWLPPLPPPVPGRTRVWIQAVSVGELLALGPVLRGLHAAGAEIVLTTTTSTGRRLATERYGELAATLAYFPLDAWPCSAAAWRALGPQLVVLAEGERWPEHVYQAERRGVPVVCVNARLSDRSFRRLSRLPGLAPLVLGRDTRFLAASAQDAARLGHLGVGADRIRITGNLKLDVTPRPCPPSEQERLRRELGLAAGPLLLGASTWPGEEAALVAAWRQARAQGLAAQLLLVPRHAERRAEVRQRLASAGVRSHFRSLGAAPAPVDVAVADTTGELALLTHLADVVFVGKSLAPHTEGQSPVEAAALGKPLLFGPGMSNFRTVAGELLAAGAAETVASAAALGIAALRLLADPAARAARGRAAETWHACNRGAAERTLAALQPFLAPPDGA
ncbi:MAG: 3-deoxy-D-manno-octulosonic acid transferase [Opitutaceae bacterium]